MIHVTYVIPGYIPGAPDPRQYDDSVRKFAETYRQFPAGCDHRLILIASNGGMTPEIEELFSRIPHETAVYKGHGWDIGAHLATVASIPAEDPVMCLSTSAYFKREGWLEAFVSALTDKGDGLFGSMSSFERRPHIRSTGFMLRAGWLHQWFPHGCNSKAESWDFESGLNSITERIQRENKGAWLVAPDGIYPLMSSREPANIYRHGDQSNIWVYDRHTDLFDKADTRLRQMMTYGALNQRMPKDPPWERRKKRMLAFVRRVLARFRLRVANDEKL